MRVVGIYTTLQLKSWLGSLETNSWYFTIFIILRCKSFITPRTCDYSLWFEVHGVFKIHDAVHFLYGPRCDIEQDLSATGFEYFMGKDIC